MIPSLFDMYDTGRQSLRELHAVAGEYAECDEAWQGIAGECWRLREDARDIDTLLADGLAELASVESWLGECEDVLNDAACLPRYDRD